MSDQPRKAGRPREFGVGATKHTITLRADHRALLESRQGIFGTSYNKISKLLELALDDYVRLKLAEQRAEEAEMTKMSGIFTTDRDM